MAQRHRRSEIVRLLRKRARRGLTYRELSEESGIPAPTLAWWSRKLEQEAGSGHGEIEELELVPVEVADDGPVESETAIEIAIGDEIRLMVPASASEDHLRRVLRVMGAC